MATPTAYKEEMRPFAAQGKFPRTYHEFKRKNLIFKGSTLPPTTTATRSGASARSY